MKRIIYMITIFTLTVFLSGCGKEETGSDTEIKYIHSEEFISSESNEEEIAESEDIKDSFMVDFTYDYTFIVRVCIGTEGNECGCPMAICDLGY